MNNPGDPLRQTIAQFEQGAKADFFMALSPLLASAYEQFMSLQTQGEAIVCGIKKGCRPRVLKRSRRSWKIVLKMFRPMWNLRS